MSEIIVTGLNVYPVKSMQGISVDMAKIAETGLEHNGVRDREFMVVSNDEDHVFITQRSVPQLAKIQTFVRDNFLRLDISGYGMVEVSTEYNDKLTKISTEVHGNTCYGYDMGKNVSEFLTDYLDRDVMLVREARDEPRYIKEPYRKKLASNRVAFGDGSPILLTSEASLFKQHEDSGLEWGAITMDRFRPNIVIDGVGLEGYEEDSWQLINIGKMAAYVIRACDRCTVPSVIQNGNNAGEQGDILVKSRFLKSRSGIDLASPSKPNGRFFG